jgi:hypothetical protein
MSISGAKHVEPADAVLAHVAERHRRASIGSVGASRHLPIFAETG